MNNVRPQAGLSAKRIAHLAAIFVLLVQHASVAQTGLVLESIADTNQLAPGSANNWSAFTSRASLGANDEIVFAANAGADQGWWYGDLGSLGLAGLIGGLSPSGGTFSGFINDVYAFNDGVNSGAVFSASQNSVSNNDIIVTTIPGPALQTIAREQGVAPGTGGNYNVLLKSFVNDSGSVVFSANLSTSPQRSLWRYQHGIGNDPELVARSLNSITNVIPGATVSVFTENYSINNNDEIACSVTFASAGTNNRGILVFPDLLSVTDPVLIARKGDLEPSAISSFDDFPIIGLNDNSDVVFKADLNTADTARNIGLYKSISGSVSAVAVEGELAPGPGTAYFTNFEEIFFANNGTVAFVATTRTTPDNSGTNLGRGVWVEIAGTLEYVARVGQQVLDKDGSTVYGNVVSLQSVSMNLDGDLILELTTNPGTVKCIYTKEATAGSPLVQYLTASGSASYGDVAYNESRKRYKITSAVIPKLENFTDNGGGPIGRGLTYNTSNRPMLRMSFDDGSSGLYLLDQQALSFYVTSTNADAPGTAGGQFESVRPTGTINKDGMSAYRAQLAVGPGGVTTSDRQGIWAERLDGNNVPELILVARQGDPAPGGGTYGALDINPVYSGTRVAYPANIVGGGSALFMGVPSSPTLIAQTGDLVGITGLPSGSTYDALRARIALNETGRLLTGIRMTVDTVLGINAQNDTAIVRYGGTTRQIAREGASAVDGGMGVFGDLLNNVRYINSSNNCVFITQKRNNTTLGINNTNNWGIWYFGSSLVPVAVGGTVTTPQVAPETGGANYLRPQQVDFNNSNRIAFLTTLQGAGVTPTNNLGMYVSNAGGTPVLVARTGSTQTSGKGPGGIAPSATFTNFGPPRLRGTTELIYKANLGVDGVDVTVNDDQGVWATLPPTNTLLLRKGQAAPDNLGSVTTQVFDSFKDPVVSPTGRVIVAANLRVGVGGVTSANNAALFVQNQNGDFVRVVQKGSSIDIPDGLGGTETIIVRDIEYTGADGSPLASYTSTSETGFILTYLTATTGETVAMMFLVP